MPTKAQSFPVTVVKVAKKPPPVPKPAPPPVDPPKKMPIRKPSRDKLVLRNSRGEPSGLKDAYAGASAFLVCGGPSLKTLDLSVLNDRGVLSMGVNNAAAYARCSMFVCGDPARKFHHAIWFDPKIQKFIPSTLLDQVVREKLPDGTFRSTKRRVDQCPNVWQFPHDGHFWASDFLSRETVTWGLNAMPARRLRIEGARCTMLMALRLLYHLGVRQVFMLGVDFNMKPGVPYAFRQKRTGEEAATNNEHFRERAFMLDELKPYFDAAGYRVFNCNEQSRLTVFPHVSFSHALDFVRNGVPAGNLDLSQWYEKPMTLPRPAKSSEPDEPPAWQRECVPEEFPRMARPISRTT